MTYPLIQRPAPMQQLAETLQAIVERRRAQQLERMQMELGQAQLAQTQAGTEQARAGTESTRLKTEQTREELGRARVTRQQLATGVAQLVRAQPDPTSDQFGQLARGILAQTSDPDAIQHLGTYFQNYTQLHQLGPQTAVAALRLQADRDQIGLDAEERVLHRGAVTETQRLMTEDPAFRTLYTKIRAGLGPYLIAQMNASTQGADRNAQLSMQRRQIVIQALNQAHENYNAARKAFAEGQPYTAYGPTGQPVDVPGRREDPTGTRTRQVPREQDYTTAALQQLANQFGLGIADIRLMIRESLQPGARPISTTPRR